MPNTAFENPTSADQHDFLLRLYFGGGGDPLSKCIQRAYLDFNRTLHGVGSSSKAFSAATAQLGTAITSLRESAPAMSQEAFDEWHKQTCDALASAYRREGYEKFYVGHGQKWINMALKYVFVFGEASLPGYSRTYTYCHVPIDNVILSDPEFKELREFKCAWSRINDYREYMAFQFAVRKRFKGSSPLAVEFVRWQAQNAA